jgi:hypothetical protein
VAEKGGELNAEQLMEQIKQIDVGDLLLSTVSTLGQVAYVKLSAREHDQARLAIDALAAVLPTLEGRADDRLVRDLKQLLADVRLAYASSVSGGGPAAAREEASGSEPQTPEAPGDEAAVSEPAPERASGSEPQTTEERATKADGDA